MKFTYLHSVQYTLKSIKEIFDTAYTAFLAARIDSIKQSNADHHVIIHTGNWGTGAYGGNKTIMAILQILAAQVAGIDSLIYHTFSSTSSESYEEALKILNENLIPNEKDIKVMNILFNIEKLKFSWGVTDGN